MTTGDLDWMYLDVEEIDLTKYLNHKHELRKPLHYREEVTQHFTGDPNSKGAWLPWESMDAVRFRNGEVSLWGGQNFSGKSALITQSMLHWLRGNSSYRERMLLISPEFSPALNLARIVQQCVGKMPVNINEADVVAVLAWLQDKFMIYDAVGSVDVDDLTAVCYYASEELGVSQVIIDNLTVIKLEGSDVNQAQAELITNFVQCARQTGLHIHAIAHTRKPQPGEGMSRYSIRGAGQLSDLSDNVLIVERNHRKEEKLADITLDDEERKLVRRQSDTKLRVDKQRHGTAWVGFAKLYFNPISMRWSERQDASDRPFKEIADLAQLGGPMRSPTI